MNTLKLDYQAAANPLWAGLLVLALGVSAAAAAGKLYLDQSRNIEAQQAKLERVSHLNPNRRNANVPDKHESEQALQQVQMANEVMRRINLPWNALFNAFEASKTDDVAILAFEPDAHKGTLRITAEAKSLESQLDYLSALQKNPLFKDVLLRNHQIQDQDPQNPVQFMLIARWGMAS